MFWWNGIWLDGSFWLLIDIFHEVKMLFQHVLSVDLMQCLIKLGLFKWIIHNVSVLNVSLFRIFIQLTVHSLIRLTDEKKASDSAVRHMFVRPILKIENEARTPFTCCLLLLILYHSKLFSYSTKNWLPNKKNTQM